MAGFRIGFHMIIIRVRRNFSIALRNHNRSGIGGGVLNLLRVFIIQRRGRRRNIG